MFPEIRLIEYYLLILKLIGILFKPRRRDKLFNGGVNYIGTWGGERHSTLLRKRQCRGTKIGREELKPEQRS